MRKNSAHVCQMRKRERERIFLCNTSGKPGSRSVCNGENPNKLHTDSHKKKKKKKKKLVYCMQLLYVELNINPANHAPGVQNGITPGS